MSDFLAELAKVVGPDHVITGQQLVSYTTDWSGRFQGDALAAVRPANTGEVSAVLKLCRDRGVAVVPQGGNTGLVGGSVPAKSDGTPGPACIVLVMTRLRRLDPVDSVNKCVTVGAGVTIAELRAHVKDAGFEYGVDFAARDSATVGGTIATDAGGVRVVFWGTTRSQVLGLEFVRADGEVFEVLGAVQKDGAGYELSSGLVGSEGTLAIITAARLKVRTPMPMPETVLIGCNDWAHAGELVNGAALKGVTLLAAEIFDAVTHDTVCEVHGLPSPLPTRWPVYLLVETDAAVDWPHEIDAVIALDSSDKQRLWRYREEASVSISTFPNVHKMDVSLPIESIDSFTKRLAVVLESVPDVTRAVVFGHIAEGNLHIDVAGPAFDDFRVDEAVYRLAADFGGSIASEHGVGRVKPHLLSLVRDDAYLALLRRIKQAWDPDWLLNPGVLVLRD